MTFVDSSLNSGISLLSANVALEEPFRRYLKFSKNLQRVSKMVYLQNYKTYYRWGLRGVNAHEMYFIGSLKNNKKERQTNVLIKDSSVSGFCHDWSCSFYCIEVHRCLFLIVWGKYWYFFFVILEVVKTNEYQFQSQEGL